MMMKSRKRGSEPVVLKSSASSAASQEVDRSLKAIYRDDSGSLPDMTKLERGRSRWWATAIVGGVVFVTILLGAAWAGVIFFNPFHPSSSQSLSMTVEGPEQVSLGKETTYFVNYRNVSGKPMDHADIRVTFPTDFVVSSADPRPESATLQWSLGSLPTDGHGTLKVAGTFTGALGTLTAIQAVGSSRLLGSSMDLDALATKSLRYADSVLDGSLAVPPKVLPGDRVTVAYTLVNNGTDPFTNVEMRLALPDGFQPMATTGTTLLDPQTAHRTIGTLDAGASTTLMVVGSFASGMSGEAHVVGLAGRSSANGTFLASQRTETSFTVLAGQLSLKLVMNGTDVDTPIVYGSRLQFGISYENTATENVKDVTLRLRFESASGTLSKGQEMVDWSALNDSTSGTRKGNTITWDARALPALANMSSHELGTIDLLVGALPVDAGTSTLAVRAVLEATIGSVGGTKVNRIVQAAPMTLTYLSDAHLTSEARYHTEEGAPIGSGPLPPVVGSSTTYRVHWSVDKRFHELSNMTVSAVLSKIASWPDKVVAEAGDVSYDPATKTVKWALNRLPADVKETAVDFDVVITPSEADADRFAQLLGETKFEATDAFVGTSVAGTSPALTTDLENDTSAQGKGVVRKP